MQTAWTKCHASTKMMAWWSEFVLAWARPINFYSRSVVLYGDGD